MPGACRRYVAAEPTGRARARCDDLNAQLRHWLDTVANPRLHATTQRIVNEAFAEGKPHLKMLPLAPFRSLLKLEAASRPTRLGSGSLKSIPWRTRCRFLKMAR